MSSTIYRRLLGISGSAAFFFSASAGRMGIAMTSLGIVWLVHGRTGSYGTAGLVAGAFAVAEASVGPQVARLIDRYGQTRVLPPLLVAHGGAATALLLAVATCAPIWLLMTGGVLVGATIPQLGALSAARWSALLEGDKVAMLPTAFALESLANAAAYLVGPSLVSTIGAAGHAPLGTALAASLVVGGGLAFAAQRRTAPRPAHGAGGHRHAGRSLLVPGFMVLVSLNVALGGFFSAMQVSIPAFAVEHHAAASAAAFVLISNVASLIAGWLYGLRRWRATHRLQLTLATIGMALGSTLLLVDGQPLVVGVGIVLTGLAIPVILILCAVLIRSTVRSLVLTQAFTWQNSASAAGSAAVAAFVGRVVDGSGAHGGFVVATAATTALALLGASALRVFQEVGGVDRNA